MSENREYVTNQAENGSVNISEDVVAIVAATAIVDVEGAAGLSNTIGKDIADLFGKKNASKGVKIQFGEDTITVDTYVMISYGSNVIEVCEKIQEAVKNAIESMTGIQVDAVNVNVCGIAFEKAKK